MIQFISVHVPKCAGTSLQTALTRAYGKKSIYVDSKWSPGNPLSPMNLDPDGYCESFRATGYPLLEGKQGVHGHFHIRKYDLLRDPCIRFAFLRHPVARTISHFRYWQSYRDHPLRKYMWDNRLDVIRFARLPLIRYFYSRTFFGGVARSRFDFVGCTEALNRDLPRLEALLERRLDVATENVTSGNDHLVADAEIRATLESILAEDIAFYREWCAPE